MIEEPEVPNEPREGHVISAPRIAQITARLKSLEEALLKSISVELVADAAAYAGELRVLSENLEFAYLQQEVPTVLGIYVDALRARDPYGLLDIQELEEKLISSVLRMRSLRITSS